MALRFGNAAVAGLGALTALAISSCGGQSLCSDGEVLKTVKKAFDRQQFGQFIQAPDDLFTVRQETATQTSIDRQSGKCGCAVVVRSDILAMARFTGTSAADVAKMREEAPKRGVSLTKDYLINFTVQPMSSGEKHVTVFP